MTWHLQHHPVITLVSCFADHFCNLGHASTQGGINSSAPLSSANCAVRRRVTSSMRFTAREFMSAENSCVDRRVTQADVGPNVQFDHASPEYSRGQSKLLEGNSMQASAAHGVQAAARLVAKHGEALLERQLEPIAAGHAVARPAAASTWLVYKISSLPKVGRLSTPKSRTCQIFWKQRWWWYMPLSQKSEQHHVYDSHHASTDDRHRVTAGARLWKYSCATTPSTRAKSRSVDVAGDAMTRRELKMLSDLFSMAPMLKSLTATILNRLRSYSRPATAHAPSCVLRSGSRLNLHWQNP